MLASRAVSTPRLIGEPLREEHRIHFREMSLDPEVMRTLSATGLPLPDAEIHEMFQANLDHWRDHGFGIWMFFEPGSVGPSMSDTEAARGSFVGRGGVRHLLLEGRDEIEISYALMPAFWGMGLATEIALLSRDVALNELGFRNIVCLTLHRNIASRRVMEKAGFTYERECLHARLPHVLHRITLP